MEVKQNISALLPLNKSVAALPEQAARLSKPLLLHHFPTEDEPIFLSRTLGFSEWL